MLGAAGDYIAVDHAVFHFRHQNQNVLILDILHLMTVVDMKFVLLIVMIIGGKSSMTTAEFNSKSACEYAADSFNKDHEKWTRHIKTYCFEKGIY